jgi:aquaporin Z
MTSTGTTPTDPEGDSFAPPGAVPSPTDQVDPELAYAQDNDWLTDAQPATTGPGWPALLAAEAFGTFLLVLAGVGTAMYAGLTGIGGGPLAVAIAFGLALTAGIVAVGRVSGGYFNPAVSLGAAVAGRLPWIRLVPYWVAEVIGGLGAALVVFLAVPTALPTAVSGKATTVREYFSSVSNGFDASATALHSPLGKAANQVMTSATTALLVEAVLTAVFVGVILAATSRRANAQHAPFAIGATLAVLVLVAMPLTNASLNPARSLATAVFSSSWALGQVWLFWVAPLFGGLVAGLFARVFGANRPIVPLDEDEDEDLDESIEIVVERS